MTVGGRATGTAIARSTSGSASRRDAIATVSASSAKCNVTNRARLGVSKPFEAARACTEVASCGVIRNVDSAVTKLLSTRMRLNSSSGPPATLRTSGAEPSGGWVMSGVTPSRNSTSTTPGLYDGPLGRVPPGPPKRDTAGVPPFVSGGGSPPCGGLLPWGACPVGSDLPVMPTAGMGIAPPADLACIPGIGISDPPVAPPTACRASASALPRGSRPLSAYPGPASRPPFWS